MRTCFKRALDAQKNATSGEGSKYRGKYHYFDQLLFLLPHLEDCETRSNLRTKKKKKKKKGTASKCSKKEASEPLLQTLRQKKIDDIYVDEKKGAFYCLYSYISGSLTKNRSFWLGWKFSKLCDTSNCNKIWIHTHLAPCPPFQTQTVSLQTHRILQPTH